MWYCEADPEIAESGQLRHHLSFRLFMMFEIARLPVHSRISPRALVEIPGTNSYMQSPDTYEIYNDGKCPYPDGCSLLAETSLSLRFWIKGRNTLITVSIGTTTKRLELCRYQILQLIVLESATAYE